MVCVSRAIKPRWRRQMNAAQIQIEAAKLNQSQRAALRNAIGAGRLDALTVISRGCYTEVRAEMYGFRHYAMIGLRGKIMQREVF